MIEFFKILIEEPAKLLKFVLLITKFILNVCFAYILYVWTIGTPTLINFNDIDGLFLFVVTGKILIPIVLYFISEVFLFQFFSGLPLLPLDYLAKKIDLSKPDQFLIGLLRWGLKKSKIISVDKKTNITSAGDNINLFHDFLLSYSEKEVEDEIHTIRHSLVNKVMNLFFIFLIMYLFLFDLAMKNNVFNYILVVLSIILPIVYIEIHIVIDFLNKNSKDLLLGVNQLRFEKLIVTHLKEIGLSLVSLDNNDAKSLKYITNNNKDYLIQYYYGRSILDKFYIESYVEAFLKAEKCMILITNSELSNDAKELANEYNKSLIILRFEHERDLIEKLESLLRKK